MARMITIRFTTIWARWDLLRQEVNKLTAYLEETHGPLSDNIMEVQL